MGPNLIFDKSFLQCINSDESVWLDTFFSTNITPLFFIETLADLEKEVLKGRTPEDVVGSLATKTPDMDVVPNMHHRAILEGELFCGDTVDMKTGRPLRAGGIYTKLDGQKGVVYEQSPEEEAFNRWQRRDFLELERKLAKDWRHTLSLISSKDQQLVLQGWYGNKRPKDLAAVKDFADKFIDGTNQRNSFTFGLNLIGVNPDFQEKILQRWVEAGSPLLRKFVPYFRHVYGIELFFYMARSADLISERQTNKVDLAYLYYLPFCMVFTSNDKLHRNTVPLFMRSDQSFIWGLDLKDDLRLLDEYYSNLTDDVKKKGLHYFAAHPPSDNSFLVTKLWDKHMRHDWRKLHTSKDVNNKDAFVEDIIAKIRRATKNALDNPLPPLKDSENVDFAITKHYVHKTKGKWNRFPPEVDKTDNDLDD